MTYGMRLYDKDGNITLDISDRTPRLFSITAVTVPSSGTTTVTVDPTITTTNSIAVTENDALAQVTSSGTVTLYGSAIKAGSTNLRILVLEP